MYTLLTNAKDMQELGRAVRGWYNEIIKAAECFAW
jgi:hypothetical protein